MQAAGVQAITGFKQTGLATGPPCGPTTSKMTQ